MSRIRPIGLTCLFITATAVLTKASVAPAADESGASVEALAPMVAQLIAESIPRVYERSEDWGRTKRITTGLRSSGNFFKFDIHRRKTHVKHGVWKKYRVTLIDPDKNLLVRIENLRSIAPGHAAFTLVVSAKLHGWVRAKIYDRGVHLIALEADADASVRLSLDAEITLESVKTSSYLPGLAVRPIITGARHSFDEFRLNRVSDLRGSVARELGERLRHVIQDELSDAKLTSKLNRAIEKRRDWLEFTPDMLLRSQP